MMSPREALEGREIMFVVWMDLIMVVGTKAVTASFRSCFVS